jgi:hypothetical protein
MTSIRIVAGLALTVVLASAGCTVQSPTEASADPAVPPIAPPADTTGFVDPDPPQIE